MYTDEQLYKAARAAFQVGHDMAKLGYDLEKSTENFDKFKFLLLPEKQSIYYTQLPEGMQDTLIEYMMDEIRDSVKYLAHNQLERYSPYDLAQDFLCDEENFTEMTEEQEKEWMDNWVKQYFPDYKP